MAATRYRLFCDTYRLPPGEQHDLLTAVVQRTWRMRQLLVDKGDREPFASLVRDGHADFWRRVAQHIEALVAGL